MHGGRAITALSQGLARAGTWMNTGEGGLSEYHLKGGGDIIFQIGPGLLVFVIKMVTLRRSISEDGKS